MEIYILRHGIAESQRAGRADSERKLTEEGREKLRLVLARARKAGVAPSLVLTSPLVRAVQTAEVAAQALGYAGEIEKTDALVPSSSSRQVWRLLRSRADETAVLLSGHEPLLSETASYLVGCSRVCFDLKKGALLRIDVDEFPTGPRGVLQWLLTPKLAAP
jgi:phosphohistidine phosphatase